MCAHVRASVCTCACESAFSSLVVRVCVSGVQGGSGLNAHTSVSISLGDSSSPHDTKKHFRVLADFHLDR